MKSNSCCNNASKFSKLIQIIIASIIVLIILRSFYINSSLFYRKDINLPLTLRLNKQDLYITKGEEYKLYVLGINKRVSYSSTNFRVAGVNFNGRVYGHQVGKAYIIAKVNGDLLKCRVYVIDLNKNNIYLKVGQNYDLDVRGANTYVRWKSSNVNIASVSFTGKVKAKNRGKTEIIAKIKGKELKCSVYVE